MCPALRSVDSFFLCSSSLDCLSTEFFSYSFDKQTFCGLLVVVVPKIRHAKVSTTSRTCCQFGNKLWIIVIWTFSQKHFSEMNLLREFCGMASLEETERDPDLQSGNDWLLFMARITAVQALTELRWRPQPFQTFEAALSGVDLR